MPIVTGVQLRFSKTLWFDPAGTDPRVGDLVVVKTSRGEEMGRVRKPPFDLDDPTFDKGLKPVLRIANERDLNYQLELDEKEKEALPVFFEMIEEHELAMHPVDIEYLISGDKIVFYFSAEERVDFRDLVRDLSARFKARIDMRQVGVRDEARMVGGLSHCGEQLCCARMGGEFAPVSIKMAKDQGLPLNPAKISGLCGRLMCCLRYEVDAYNDFNGRAPRRGSMVTVSDGNKGKVSELDAVRERVSLRFPREDMPDETVTVNLCDLQCEKNGKQSRCTIDAATLDERRIRAQDRSTSLLTGNARFLDNPNLTGDASALGAGDTPVPVTATAATNAKDNGDRDRSGAGAGRSDGPGSGAKNNDNKRRRRSRRRRPDTAKPAAPNSGAGQAQGARPQSRQKPGGPRPDKPKPKPFTPPKDDRVPRRRHR